MTTARRRARGSARTSGIAVDGAVAPAELFDASAEAWQSDDAYRGWIERHDLSVEQFRIMLWMGHQAHPANRRNHAAEAWAEKAGVLLQDHLSVPRADWHKLRAAGLIDRQPPSRTERHDNQSPLPD